MKALRRKIALLLITAFTMSMVLLSGCGGGGSEKEMTPEEVVNAFGTEFNKGEFKELEKYVEDGLGEDEIGSYGTRDDLIKEMTVEGLSEDVAGKLIDLLLSAKITTKEANIDGDKAVVPATVEAVDFDALMEALMEKIFSSIDLADMPETDEEIGDLTNKLLSEVLDDMDNPERITIETDVNLIKKDGKWIISKDNEEFIDSLFGDLTEMSSDEETAEEEWTSE